MKKVFVSHLERDKVIATKLAKRLRSAGHKVWLDDWAIEVGDSIAESISNGLAGANYLIVCLSAVRLTPWMSAEVWSSYTRQLNGQSIRLLPVKFHDGPVPAFLAHLAYADLRADWNRGVEELLRAIS